MLEPPSLGDALRRPEQRQFFADIIAQAGIFLQPLHGMPCAPPMNSLVVSVPVAIAIPASVPLDLSADR